jgi:hypothetical protein
LDQNKVKRAAWSMPSPQAMGTHLTQNIQISATGIDEQQPTPPTSIQTHATVYTEQQRLRIWHDQM